MTTEETVEETWQQVADRHTALGLDSQTPQAVGEAVAAASEAQAESDKAYRLATSAGDAEAFVITAGELSLIGSCLIGFKRLLDWAELMVGWVEANTELDATTEPDEYGNSCWTNRIWCDDMKSKRLPEHMAWYMAAKEIKRRPVRSPEKLLDAIPTLSFAAPAEYLATLTEENSDDDS